MSKNDDKSAAIGFIYSLLEAERMGKISYKKSNFYIAQENDNMDNITKLATLLPTKLTITNMCSIVSQIDHGVYHDARKVWLNGSVIVFCPLVTFVVGFVAHSLY